MNESSRVQQQGRKGEIGSQKEGGKSQLEKGSSCAGSEKVVVTKPGIKGPNIDLTGMKLERLTAIRHIGMGRWEWQCECGKIVVTAKNQILSGHTKSCGCLNRELLAKAHTKTGLAGTPIYTIWMAMHDRCRNPNSPMYYRYGGRGITVCSRWSGRDGFANFLADMGHKPEGKSINRINNDLGYSPENCEWATPAQQNRCMSRNIWLTIPDGRRMILADAAIATGIHRGTLLARYKTGTELFRPCFYPKRKTKKQQQ